MIKSLTGITTDTVVLATRGRLHWLTVTATGSVEGSVHDVDTIGAADPTNAIAELPIETGLVAENMPLDHGLVVKPGIGQTVAASYSTWR
jgi:hypothetical protein